MSRFTAAMTSTAGAAAKRRPKPPPKSENLKIEPVRGRGRPRGGRSGDRAGYQPLTVYIARDIHGEVGARLHREGGQFSDVIEKLLRLWLQQPNVVS
jgi:hypothetical protein